MKEYWDCRFAEGGEIWGEYPSSTAYHALELFQKNGVKSIFVPGAGYGRNSRLFSSYNFHVAGIEISDIAYNIAKIFDPKSDIQSGTVFDMALINERFDALYCFNVLHLFKKQDRDLLVKLCENIVNPNGFLFFTVFSDTEESYGKGKEIEPNTYESKPGRSVHYFSEDELLRIFEGFIIHRIGIVDEKENHGKLGDHIHNLRYIFAQKKQ